MLADSGPGRKSHILPCFLVLLIFISPFADILQLIERIKTQSLVYKQLMDGAKILYKDISSLLTQLDTNLLGFARRNDLSSMQQFLFADAETAKRFLELRYRLLPHHRLSADELQQLADFLEMPVEDLPLLKREFLDLFPEPDLAEAGPSQQASAVESGSAVFSPGALIATLPISELDMDEDLAATLDAEMQG